MNRNLKLLLLTGAMLGFASTAYAVATLVTTASGAPFNLRWCQLTGGDKCQATVLIDPATEALMTPLKAGDPVTVVPGTTGLPTPYPFIAAASDNHQNIGGTSGPNNVTHVDATNSSTTTDAYLRLYNAGPGFNGCGSNANLRYGVAILHGSGISSDFSNGKSFPNGVSSCVTGGIADNDTTPSPANVVRYNIDIK